MAYFKFNNGSLLSDWGPNKMTAITQSTSLVSSGHSFEAITFNGSTSSYFQISGLTAIGVSNKAFSFSIWIRPTTLEGVIIHVSSSSNGQGWCLPFVGFANNGSLLAQIYDGSAAVTISSSISTSVWSHVVQTWSTTNGLRLYINNVLVASQFNGATVYSASQQVNYVTLGNSLSGVLTCTGASVNMTAYKGDMDDFQIYSRELCASDVSALFSN